MPLSSQNSDLNKCLCRFVSAMAKKGGAFSSGFIVGQVFYYYFLRDIPIPGNYGEILCLCLSILLGTSNVVSRRFRCVYILNLPMAFGKPGRGVLKAMILTFIVTGPIINMGLNAKEVVRVFACSTQLAYNLSQDQYTLRLGPVRAAALATTQQVEDFKDSFRTIKEMIEVLEQEVEDTSEMEHIRYENNLIDDIFAHKHRSDDVEANLKSVYLNGSIDYDSLYRKKLLYRCEELLSRAITVCMQQFKTAYHDCCKLIPHYTKTTVCLPLAQKETCDINTQLDNHSIGMCNPPALFDLGEKILALKKVKTEFVDKLDDVNLKAKPAENFMVNARVAKETAESLQQAFEEKAIIMRHFLTVMKICIALLFLRIFTAAVKYHDRYLTNVDYDNVYITDYFKRLDAKRRRQRKHTLLPLKKMERNRYIDVYSASYKDSQRSSLMLHVLKVFLEVVTATTFVMLDRLFYEALEVVKQHAQTLQRRHTRDQDIQVEGSGILAALLSKYLKELNEPRPTLPTSNADCLPHPRQMPYIYFLKIYGGYAWIVILLLANPYTARIKRLISGHFYPQREKERILHLYNDILKKRMKMHKTLRRKAVQAVRAHYLSGDVLSLLSLRMKFPQLLAWLRAVPAARMCCLICGETEPRTDTKSHSQSAWHRCLSGKCPFIYCAECWREVAARCIACEPSLAEFSDVDSHTDDEPSKY